MKVAVLMSTYNGERYIQEQIESILTQNIQTQVDLWVRDDGSGDTTQRILQEYHEAGKLQWYAGTNLRPAHSFWDLLQHCPGYDFYAFADQDDVWHPDKLAKAIQPLMNVQGPAMYFANARLVDGSLHDLGRDVYRRKPQTDFYSLICNGGILGCTIGINASLAQLVQQAPIPKKMIMHDAFVAAVCAMYDGVIIYDDEAHMDYRQHGHNVVGSKWTKMDALKDRIKAITTARKVSIADQAQSLLDCFPQVPDSEKSSFLYQVADYRTTMWNALRLSLSNKLRFNGKNMEITARLSIMLRNR